jgi:hypothetical protein
MNLIKRFITCGLAVGALGLAGSLAGCSLSAHVYDPGGPYYDGGYVAAPAYGPGHYQPYSYYSEPGVGIYYYDGGGHRHYGRYREHEAREWHRRYRR